MSQSETRPLPVVGLIALALSGFITILTEVLPAGLLRQMSDGLAISEGMVGQLVTVYAVGSIAAAIPITLATQRWRRRPLLLSAVGGFALANTVTAVSSDYAVILVARFVAGMSAGLLWALLAVYASRMAPRNLRGRAIAIAMAGTPVALSLGVPAGTFLGIAFGWRSTFAIMSAISVLLIVWILARVPDFPGQEEGRELGLGRVLAIPGVRSVLFVVLTFVLAHNVLYTYIAPFATLSGLEGRIDVVLLVFGVFSIVSIYLVGAMIDRHLRLLTLGSVVLFIVAGGALGLAGGNGSIVFVSMGLWGLAFGGAATLFQTACANAAKDAADVAQSMLVTVWNTAIAGGGIVGGLLLEATGAASLPWVLCILLVLALVCVMRARTHGFPAASDPAASKMGGAVDAAPAAAPQSAE
ncbi:MFS transporter [Breoghania sp. JC706]|uniref:MFS transporter n=1 Tax=Breoghania sp. JC706 TaxID=3117732 RepID=UPI00300BB6D5